ncbi:glycosyltransferase [Mycobacterium sp. NPDC048908]|uniref:glycosyltransferase n=1 Tax=Mycobacterium sp. NPDC048908 TaxID=3364292 RepID=UPI0037235D7F
MARYLIAASPIPGHVMPLLLVGRDLRRRGHDVTVLTGAEHREAIRDAGLRSVALPAAAHPLRSPVVDRPYPELIKRWLGGRAEIMSVFIEPLAAQYQAARDILRAECFDAVLSDIAFTGVLPLLLTDEPRPRVLACGVGPLTLSSVSTPPFGTAWRPKPDRGYRAMTWVVHNGLMADIQRGLDETLCNVGVRRCPVFLTDWPALADRLLQFTIPALEYHRRDLPANVSFTGPVIGATPPRIAPTHASRTRAVVHVTQGTWDNQSLDDLLVPTLNGLADRDDLRVVATTGRPGDHGLGQPIPDNAYVTDFLPYSELLPTVDVMVTNGGYGGVHHALLHGVPLVVAGGTADKPEMAARVAHAGVGVDLGAARPTAAAVADAVQHVLSTPRYREAARCLGREMLQHNAFDNIVAALGDLGCSASSPRNGSGQDRR